MILEPRNNAKNISKANAETKPRFLAHAPRGHVAGGGACARKLGSVFSLFGHSFRGSEGGEGAHLGCPD